MHSAARWEDDIHLQPSTSKLPSQPLVRTYAVPAPAAFAMSQPAPLVASLIPNPNGCPSFEPESQPSEPPRRKSFPFRRKSKARTEALVDKSGTIMPSPPNTPSPPTTRRSSEPTPRLRRPTLLNFPSTSASSTSASPTASALKLRISEPILQPTPIDSFLITLPSPVVPPTPAPAPTPAPPKPHVTDDWEDVDSRKPVPKITSLYLNDVDCAALGIPEEDVDTKLKLASEGLTSLLGNVEVVEATQGLRRPSLGVVTNGRKGSLVDIPTDVLEFDVAFPVRRGSAAAPVSPTLPPSQKPRQPPSRSQTLPPLSYNFNHGLAPPPSSHEVLLSPRSRSPSAFTSPKDLFDPSIVRPDSPQLGWKKQVVSSLPVVAVIPRGRHARGISIARGRAGGNWF
ncbi:hypothetical protein MNV49_007524 [Pseudohyphozyma bogoriensis]|nr:hypothetical protein MNV49_007524 [Pseudohyphozyma bogoriensis]